ncbi:MAG: M3 family metallopeptidase [Candidatus Latescibacterota bacterium]|nr:MAG: M3 family metallopeptidase [Candidatus Latescibacterota bacterium]
MWKGFILLLVTVLMFASCQSGEKGGQQELTQTNPFFSDYDTPFGVPPFNTIELEHYKPAFEEGIKRHDEEIAAIVNNAAAPTFENTIEALDRSGVLLTNVSNVFFNLNSSMTNDDMQALAKEVAPMLSAHQDDITLNADLFARVKAVYDSKNSLNLTPEQTKLLDDGYKAFVRNGANLDDTKKAKLREINEELSVLTLNFGENVLKENNTFEMVIEDEKDLAGLPDAAISGASEAAGERGHEGKWVFTLHKPSMIPFLQYAENRELRDKIFKAYIHRGDNNNDLDNKEILSKIAALRVERASLLGYETHAHFVLEENMAKKPEKVYELLDKLWKPALAKAKVEVVEMQKMIDGEGGGFKLEAWDWWYYAEKVKKAKYDLDEEMLRPYFELENVRRGAFELATKLYGITFTEITDIPKYHEDVKVFEVKEADGKHIGLLYVDYFPRESKRGGAWMSAFRKQSKRDGEHVTPVIVNCGNFSKPTGDKPALLSWDEVNTLFHEFGHGLHGLLSNCTYESLSGTSVATDFVELPSQIMENWASEPEVLRMYALHYETGEPMPDELIEKIRKARHFNQGFATTEYLAASFLDMDWHTLTEAKQLDPVAFENKSLDNIGLIPEIVVRYRSPYFRHIFAGGYASGYYSYVWAEVLDADAFEAFKETSLFDRKTAQAFRDNILAAGGTDDAMTLYVKFRGAEPKIEPLLERRGLN